MSPLATSSTTSRPGTTLCGPWLTPERGRSRACSTPWARGLIPVPVSRRWRGRGATSATSWPSQAALLGRSAWSSTSRAATLSTSPPSCSPPSSTGPGPISPDGTARLIKPGGDVPLYVQGAALLANNLRDPGLLARQVRRLEKWVDSLEYRPGALCPPRWT
jgi:hypothetical protein